MSTSKVPKFRELRITETPEGVVVDFFPDLYVVPVVEKESTAANPDIKLDIGKVGGQMQPLRAYYPPGTTPEEIMEKVDLLFSKIESCPNCERKKRMVLGKLEKMLKERGQGAMFEKLKAKMKEKEAQPIAPQKEFKMQEKTQKPPLEQRVQQNVMQAIDDAYVMVRGFFVPPVKPIRPDDWLKIVEGKKP